MAQNKKVSDEHQSITDKLKKLASKKPVVYKRKICKDRLADETDDYKIQDGTWKDNVDEINQNIGDEENDGVD